MKGRVKVTEGYWRLEDFRGLRVCHVTKDGDRFILEYVLYRRKENSIVTGTMLLEGKDPYWATFAQPISEKEYFLARLREKP